jgi:hypothetical protein
MLSARDRYDKDGNPESSEDEITSRLNALFTRGMPWVGVVCQVFRGGQPLAGANVRFVPEPFIEDALQPAMGITDNEGRTSPTVADDKLPADKQGLRIMQSGVYRVEIEHPSIKQPHKPLGCEIDPLSRGGTEPVFHL